jgi:hypothetical protein
VEGTEWMQGSEVTIQLQENPESGGNYAPLRFYNGTELINSFYSPPLEPGLNIIDVYLDPEIYPVSDNYYILYGMPDYVVAVSDTFSIIEMQNIVQILTPNTQTHWYYQNNETIEWYCFNTNSVKIELSTDNRNNWITLEDSYPVQQDGYNYYEWQIDIAGLTSGQTYTSVIKISDAENSDDNISSQPFILERHSSGIFEVPISNNNDWLYNNTYARINWISYEISAVDIEYSTDGTNWISIANNINCQNALNSWLWHVPDDEFSTINSNSYIKVKESGNEINFATSQALTLSNVPEIEFLNIQNEYEIGETYTLQIQNNTSETWNTSWIYLDQRNFENHINVGGFTPGLKEVNIFIDPNNFSAYNNCLFRFSMYKENQYTGYREEKSNTFALVGETPQIITTEFYFKFGDIAVGEISEEQSFLVQAQNLYEDLEIIAPNGYEISSTSGMDFTNLLTLEQTGGAVVETKIFVRFTPYSDIIYYDYINIQSNYALTQYIEVKGSGIITTKQ